MGGQCYIDSVLERLQVLLQSGCTAAVAMPCAYESDVLYLVDYGSAESPNAVPAEIGEMWRGLLRSGDLTSTQRHCRRFMH
jgi:hypothetical protein